MVNLIKIIVALSLTAIALVFLSFAVQNNAAVNITLTPSFNFDIALYLVVFISVFTGFISAVIITRFEHVKDKLNIIKLVKKLKKHNKQTSKYTSE